MIPVQIADGIYHVGVNDWNITDFHGYSTPYGTSYNAFLVVDEKIALFDTVRKEFGDQLLDNISRVVDPSKIDLVVSNHTEMDHSGSLPRVMHRIGEGKPLYCSKMGAKNLVRHFSSNWNIQPVANGEELNLGRRTVSFLETRMLHWPDSMFSYLKEDQILFSSDAFGQHYAGLEMFDDQMGDAILPHAKKYYTNILLHFSTQVLKLLDRVQQMGLGIKMICPDHGILWRRDPGKIVAAYADWARQQHANKAIVVYDTMWHSTEMMADAITSGIGEAGVPVRPMCLKKWHRSDIVTELMDARAVVVGSPTLNNNLYPTVADFLCYMRGLRPRNKIGAAFGSYGWSGEAVKQINQELEAMKIELVDVGLRQQWVPDKDGLQAAFEMGRRIGQAVLGE